MPAAHGNNRQPSGYGTELQGPRRQAVAQDLPPPPAGASPRDPVTQSTRELEVEPKLRRSARWHREEPLHVVAGSAELGQGGASLIYDNSIRGRPCGGGPLGDIRDDDVRARGDGDEFDPSLLEILAPARRVPEHGGGARKCREGEDDVPAMTWRTHTGAESGRGTKGAILAPRIGHHDP